MGIHYVKLTPKKLTLLLPETRCEDVINLIFRRNTISFKIPRNKSFRNKMTISICFVHSWKLDSQQYIELSDCHNKALYVYPRTTKSEARKDFIHVSSPVIVSIARCLTFAKDLKTALCLFVFQETGSSPILTKYPLRDPLVRGHAPQYASQ